MKLFAKYSRINLISTVIIFLLGCAAFSFLLRYVIISQVDEDLKIEKNEIMAYINKNNQLPAVIEVKDQYTTYKPTEKPNKPFSKIFTNEFYDEDSHEKELQRNIEFTTSANNKWYLITVSKSLANADELIQTIILITILLISLILAATLIINRVVLKKLWRPFYSTLATIKQFNINAKQKIDFNTTDIEEFYYLNSTLNTSLSKAQKDYDSLKEFTENASHELQTPLAVIQSKLDILIQNEKLSEAEGKSIQGAYDAVQNLKKLNQSLLLLAKIENNQFSEKKQLNIADLLKNKLNQFYDLWKDMQLKIENKIDSFALNTNPQLIDILLNNLLSNATKYNYQHGEISVKLQQQKLIVSNTYKQVALNEMNLFKRFSKSDSTAEGYGLGLSIVKQICDVSGFECHYHFSTPNLHSFIIHFK